MNIEIETIPCFMSGLSFFRVISNALYDNRSLYSTTFDNYSRILLRLVHSDMDHVIYSRMHATQSCCKVNPLVAL